MHHLTLILVEKEKKKKKAAIGCLKNRQPVRCKCIKWNKNRKVLLLVLEIISKITLFRILAGNLWNSQTL